MPSQSTIVKCTLLVLIVLLSVVKELTERQDAWEYKDTLDTSPSNSKRKCQDVYEYVNRSVLWRRSLLFAVPIALLFSYFAGWQWFQLFLVGSFTALFSSDIYYRTYYTGPAHALARKHWENITYNK